MASVMLSSIGRACPVASREAYSIFIESFFSVGISEPNLNHIQRLACLPKVSVGRGSDTL